MNIGITCYPTYGGSGTVATELGRSLAHRGHHVHFITTALPYRLTGFIENIHYHEVQVLNYPLFDYTPYSLALASKMAQIARREKLDLLHVHYAVPHAASAFLAKSILEHEMRLPVVTTLHGTDITLVGADPSYFDITRFSIERSDAVTAVSDYLKNQTLYRFGTSAPIEVIPNFVDTDLFVPAGTVSRDCLAAPDEKVLMHISNFRPVKRIPDIMAVFAGVAEQMKVRLVLVGSGPEKEAARVFAEEHGLADQVTFLGPQDDVSSIIPCADIFLLLSASESFGLTALEAMSCGVPVVGTSGHGLTEVVGGDEAGLLYTVGDVPAMIEGCIALLTDNDRAHDMGAKGRKRAVRIFNRDRVVGMYEDVYVRMAEGR